MAAIAVREDRDELLRIVDDFCANALTTREFVKALEALDDRVTDEAVEDIVFDLIIYYEDFGDEYVNIPKTNWDALQRIRLFVQTDIVDLPGEPEFVFEWNRLVWYRVALFFLGLAGCVGIMYFDPKATALFMFQLFLAVMASAMARDTGWEWLRKDVSGPLPAEALYPFRNVADIVTARRTHPDFSRKRHPEKMAGDWTASPIRARVFFCFAALLSFPMILMFLAALVRLNPPPSKI